MRLIKTTIELLGHRKSRKPLVTVDTEEVQQTSATKKSPPNLIVVMKKLDPATMLEID